MKINSFSQYGEDIILSNILIRDGINLKNRGFYLDVGAHHPVRFSNTKLFYDLGWNGINIDPNEQTYEIFQKSRPRDINLELALGEKFNEMEFFKYDESALNSFVNREKELIDTPYFQSGSKMVAITTLEEILVNHLKGELPTPNFLDIDVEGYELQVLKGNNWSKYKFSYILVEQKLSSLDAMQDSIVYKFLRNLGYKPMANNGLTTIYKNFPT